VFKLLKKAGLCVYCLVCLFGLTGCEQVSAITEYFKKNDEKVKETTPVQATQPQKGETRQKPLAPDDLVRVNDWTMTKGEFQERLKALKEVVPDYDINDLDAKALVLEELIRQQLLVNDAQKTGLAQNKDIQAAVDEFRRTLIVREVARKITDNINVTEAEIRLFYEEQKQILTEPALFKVSEIVVETRLKANELLIEILKGADFATTAREHSISDSAAQGGDLGILNSVPFPQMADALLALEQGDISSVFKGSKGYYIIRLDEKKGGQPLAYDDIKEEIRQNRLLFKQQQAILDRINELKEKAHIEINEDLLKSN